MKKKKKSLEADQRLRLFQENGEVLLEDLIELCNGESNPIKSFSANQIIEATENFSETNHLIRFEFIYKGTLENRLVLIKRPIWKLYKSDTLHKISRDIGVSSMVNGHKNFLKLLGCCLEFEHPVLVFEYAERLPSNPQESLLSCEMRIKLAKEIATAVSYLHTGFSRTLIHLDVNPSNVFSFGVLLQKLMTSMCGGVECCSDDEESMFEEFDDKQNVMNLRFSNRVSKFAEEGKIYEILDPKLVENMSKEDEIRRMEAVLMLSLRCTGHRGDVPKMVEVAKELQRIERWK